MAQPTPYNRQFNFADQQALTPTAPLPADEVDNEFNSVKVTLDQTLANLAEIQRDDGALKNGIVTQDSLSPSLSVGFTLRGPWASGQNYVLSDGVTYDSKFYRALAAHLSSNANRPDVDSATWEEVADFAAITADAAASAAEAAASALAASGSASASAASASEASGYVTDASGFATAASGYVTDASGFADASAASAVAADASADAAAASALEAANVVGDGTGSVRWDVAQSLSAGEKLQARENIDVVAFGGDAGSGGTQGLVPAPAAGDAADDKFLHASGSWAAVSPAAVDKVSGGTVTSTAALDLALSSSYRVFHLSLRNFNPAVTGGILLARFSLDNGSTYPAGSSDYAWQFLYGISTAASAPGRTSNNDSGFSGSYIPVANGVTSGGTFSQATLEINPGATSYRATCVGKTLFYNGLIVQQENVGILTTSGRVTNIRIAFSNGNISTLDYELYGLR